MTSKPLGLILAGGLARRMGGGDKGMIKIGGQTILERVLERLTPQCSRIVINANGDPSRFAFTNLPVVPDDIPDFAGPLAGILAGLEWAAEEVPDTEYVASAPADCPFLPRNLFKRLEDECVKDGKLLACAKSGDWRHPVVGLWPVALRKDLRRALMDENLHKIEIWTARYGVAIAEWSDQPVDPFFNANTPEDVIRAEQIARAHPDV